MINKIFSLLGLAMKAGRIASGEFAVENEVKSGNAQLVIVADDASANTKKKFRNSCKYYKVPFVCVGRKEELGHAIGKEYRAVVAVLDSGFAKSMSAKLTDLGITIE